MKIKITHDTWLLHHPWNIRAVRVAAFVEAVSNPPRTVSREVGKQIDYFAIVAAAIDQSFDGIAPCPAAFATDNAQTVKPGTKIVERDSAVTRHSVTSERPKRILDRARLLPEQRYAVKDFYPSSVWAINKPLNDGRQHQIRVHYPMKYLFLAFSLILSGSVAAKAADINFGEAKTRYQTQNELTAWQRLRPWDVDWRRTYTWQHGRSLRTEFAPPGCYITRLVTTPSGTRMQELFIC